jgi:two-component sensor histidine kinase
VCFLTAGPGFANGVAGQFIRTEQHAGRTEFVMAEMDGPGAILRLWSANPDGAGTVRIYIDDLETPALEEDFLKLTSAGLACFPAPFSGRRALGANLYFPMPYQSRCKVTSSKPGFYYHVGYRTYPEGTEVEPFSMSLLPQVRDRSLPARSEVALADAAGAYISMTEKAAFEPLSAAHRAQALRNGSAVWYGEDARGQRRVYSAAPLVGDDVFVVLSAQSPGLFSWARLNPLTGLLFPLLTFALAFLAVWVVAERVIVRWIVYLQRIAALYARGRLSVRPLQAEQMPPEIRELAETLEDMADAIVGRDASLRESLAQKDALMREIHHRVKNNLQVISSLLNMQQRALTDPAARAAMSDTRQRITALSLIYRALYQGPDLKRVDLRPFIEELTGQLIVGDSLHGPPVQTVLNLDALVIDPDRLAPLALFAVEAITNAQKHAFAKRGGVLTVNFKVAGEEAVLEICDDGEASDEVIAATGVGRTLMTAFARQLRGRAELVRNADGGVTARLVFPTPALGTHLDPDSAAGNQAAA